MPNFWLLINRFNLEAAFSRKLNFSSPKKARLYSSGADYNNVKELKAEEYRANDQFSGASAAVSAVYYPASNHQPYLPHIHGLSREVRSARYLFLRISGTHSGESVRPLVRPNLSLIRIARLPGINYRALVLPPFQLLEYQMVVAGRQMARR